MFALGIMVWVIPNVIGQHSRCDQIPIHVCRLIGGSFEVDGGVFWYVQGVFHTWKNTLGTTVRSGYSMLKYRLWPVVYGIFWGHTMGVPAPFIKRGNKSLVMVPWFPNGLWGIAICKHARWKFWFSTRVSAIHCKPQTEVVCTPTPVWLQHWCQVVDESSHPNSSTNFV